MNTDEYRITNQITALKVKTNIFNFKLETKISQFTTFKSQGTSSISYHLL